MVTASRQTTHDCDYKYVQTPKPERFNYFVSFVKKTEDKLVPRCSPLYFLHTSPHRILDFERSALGFGPTGAPYEYPEEQEETGPDNETGVLKEETEAEESASNNLEFPTRGSEMSKRVFYRSTAQEAAKECALPVLARPTVLPSILGKNEDRELYHSVYQRTGTWKAKTVPTHWDRQQERKIDAEPEKDSSYPLCPSRSKLLYRRSQPSGQEFVTVVAEKLENRRTPDDVHIRPVPHYGGFVPRLPVIPSRTGDPRLNQTSSSATYRRFPVAELKFQDFAHQGPLSKLVTTTRPCNPFTKCTTFPDSIWT